MKSKRAHIGCMRSKEKTDVGIAGFLKTKSEVFCMAKQVGFGNTRKIGFDAKDIDIFGNDIVFGI